MNHWKNGRTHREEYPNFTIGQYVARAVQLAEMPVGGDILGHVDKDGIIIRYDRKINDFVKASVKKGIRTMFKPDDGESYYKDMRKEDIERGGKIKCLVCGKSEFAERDNFDSCPVCYWENDDYQIRHPGKSGANRMSLNEARVAYREGRPIK